MSKSLTAILFAALANLLLVVHEVVPHHHHGEVVCFRIFHCAACEWTNPDGGDYRKEQGQPISQDEDCCILGKMVMSYPEDLRHGIKESGQLSGPGFQECLMPENNLKTPLIYPQFFRQYPSDSKYFPSVLTYTHGVRAPPQNK